MVRAIPLFLVKQVHSCSTFSVCTGCNCDVRKS